MNRVLVAGATGVTGSAIVRHFAGLSGWEVVATSRRAPWWNVSGVTHVAADLSDAAACRAAFAGQRDVTQLIYAAVNENEADIVAGWDDPAQAAVNVAMLGNLLDALDGGALQHVTLIHGMKAYGSHLPHIRTRLPFKESDATYDQLNFYHHQQALVAERAAAGGWGWTVLRPNGTIGAAVGGNMNWSLVIALFAALCADADEALPTPPGESAIVEITDADLIAAACEWAAQTPVARNDVFNITNGDQIAMHSVWDAVAGAYGLARLPPAPFSLTAELARLGPRWPEIVRCQGLRAPADLAALLGATPQFMDLWSAELPAERRLMSGLSSTIKLRQAGFGDCIDSVAAIGKYVARYREARILP